MKLSKPLILAVAGAVIAFALVVTLAHRRYPVKIGFTNRGLKYLTCNGVDYLQGGELNVHQVLLKNAQGQVHSGSIYGEVKVDAEHHESQTAFPWGNVKLEYSASGNRLAVAITTTNTSHSDTIESLWYQPLTLRFPAKVKEYDGSIPLLAHNIGDVAVIKASYASGALAVVAEDIKKPLMVGFPWADNRPENTIFPLSVSTGRVQSYPDSYPAINRPILPGETDEYRISIRFGPANESEADFAEDLYKQFGQAYPAQLKWPDRRPIGAIFLASSAQGWVGNPRGWLNDAQLNVMTAEGRAEFRQKLLAVADGAIAIMKDMNAQGAITWDIEGQEYAHAVSYIGDPRRTDELAPEMGPAADDYFERFRKAGLRVGICVRPQELQIAPDRKTATQTVVDDPTQLLIDKIGYAKKRWGISLVYIDSNTNLRDSNPTNADVLQKVAAAFPDVLLIPEHANLRYYAYTAPYRELRQGFTGTPERTLDTYPKAFTVLYTADGLIDYYHKKLATAVKHGDSLMYRTWWRDPQNEKIRTLLTP